MHNITEIQAELIKLGYLPAVDPETLRPSDDGKFGTKSLAAYNHFRASKGRPPVKLPTMTELNADLFPQEQPAPVTRSNPINDFLTGLVVKTALNQLVKGLPAMNVLAGAKTIIVSSLLVVVGVLELFGIYIDQFGHTPPGVLISAGLIGIFMRLGISNAITKALTDGVSGLGK